MGSMMDWSWTTPTCFGPGCGMIKVLRSRTGLGLSTDWTSTGTGQGLYKDWNGEGLGVAKQ